MLPAWGSNAPCIDMCFVSGLAVLIFLLFAVVNLSVGFAAAVLLGYGPQPWYALILPSKRDNTIQIDAIDSEEEVKTEESDAANPPVEAAPNVVNQPFPEMNEPEDIPAEPAPVAETTPEPKAAPDPEPEAEPEPKAEEVTEPSTEEDKEPIAETPDESDEDNELEDYLAGRKEETEGFEKEEAAAAEKPAEIASADDIESMFAATENSEDESASEEETTTEAESSEEDKPLDQDDIAALFNS